MKNVILTAAMFATVMSGAVHILVNADNYERQACLENAICYKSDALK